MSQFVKTKILVVDDDEHICELIRLYFEKENLAENKKYIEENHKENLAQVFTDVRSPRKDNELFSKTFLDFIVKQGFRLPD